nr:hypothetical protein [Chlamydiota bacterium]
KEISSLAIPDSPARELFQWVKQQILTWRDEEMSVFLDTLEKQSSSEDGLIRSLEILPMLIDHRYSTGSMQKSRLLSRYHQTLSNIVKVIRRNPTPSYACLGMETNENQTIVIDANGFSSESTQSLAPTIVRMYREGYKKFLITNCKGQRFIANGLGGNSHGVHIDVYGCSGDYIASGIDGASVYVHGNAQDQVGQIMKNGTIVIYGDVGQTFLYASKGGKAFVLGNAAGRSLISAVGVPRVVINGTCLDYLGESFMAGNPLEKGGFIVLNGIEFDSEGNIVDLEDPYPGSNLLSLSSGGAIYIRDPEGKVSEEQLNGGEIVELTQEDWEVIIPYLEENDNLFNIPISRLLKHKGRSLSPNQIYRKIRPGAIRELEAEEVWVRKR